MPALEAGLEELPFLAVVELLRATAPCEAAAASVAAFASAAEAAAAVVAVQSAGQAATWAAESSPKPAKSSKSNSGMQQINNNNNFYLRVTHSTGYHRSSVHSFRAVIGITKILLEVLWWLVVAIWLVVQSLLVDWVTHASSGLQTRGIQVFTRSISKII